MCLSRHANKSSLPCVCVCEVLRPVHSTQFVLWSSAAALIDCTMQMIQSNCERGFSSFLASNVSFNPYFFKFLYEETLFFPFSLFLTFLALSFFFSSRLIHCLTCCNVAHCHSLRNCHSPVTTAVEAALL